jgi:hypothetical protein
MRKTVSSLVLALFSVALLTGCAAYSVAPVTGMLFTDVQAPLETTGNKAQSSKVGTAMCQSYLGLFATGDASIKAAMADGGITKVHYVDYHSTSFLGLYAKFVVTVYGE